MNPSPSSFHDLWLLNIVVVGSEMDEQQYLCCSHNFYVGYVINLTPTPTFHFIIQIYSPDKHAQSLDNIKAHKTAFIMFQLNDAQCWMFQ